jgi:hypothetical protein
VVLSLGLSVVVPTLTTVALDSVRGHLSGVVKRINTAVSRVASLLTTEVLGVVMFATFSSTLDSRGAIVDLSPESKASLE